ncbi:MAG: ImmA/IrrE family metallo-endopeptidase [Bacteroides sp.]|nr:ImmA/IrrE family metallo-endopeptidase [Bacteroides sp.]
MFDLANFYQFCENNDVDIIPYLNAPSEGTTIRDEDYYAIFLDITKLRSIKVYNGVCLHEVGHVATGALHKVDSPYETVERSEYRANRWGFENYLRAEEFKEAFAAGYTELWQLSDYFDLPEETIRKALSYWTEQRGINFNE